MAKTEAMAHASLCGMAHTTSAYAAGVRQLARFTGGTCIVLSHGSSVHSCPDLLALPIIIAHCAGAYLRSESPVGRVYSL